VITLTLLHPVQATPVQRWDFEDQSRIRIGRAAENHVVLYSAVVSRFHAELRWSGQQWELENQGTNGTYLDGQRVHHAVLLDGSLIRLARSGPTLQVRFSATEKPGTPGSLLRSPSSPVSQAQAMAETDERLLVAQPAETPGVASDLPQQRLTQTQTEGDRLEASPVTVHQVEPLQATCQHGRTQPGDRFCIDCGSLLSMPPSGAEKPIA
jgi:serine/threonine-protein kinase